MSINYPKTLTELRLFEERVIRDYKLQREAKRNNKGINLIISRFKTIIPINIAIGVIASVLLVIYVGWNYFFQLMLSGIIWITLISTVIGTVVKKK
jgi:ABC-type multidrug transport system permease subunit